MVCREVARVADTFTPSGCFEMDFCRRGRHVCVGDHLPFTDICLRKISRM